MFSRLFLNSHTEKTLICSAVINQLLKDLGSLLKLSLRLIFLYMIFGSISICYKFLIMKAKSTIFRKSVGKIFLWRHQFILSHFSVCCTRSSRNHNHQFVSLFFSNFTSMALLAVKNNSNAFPCFAAFGNM